MSDIKEYNKDIEFLFIRFMMSNSDLFARCLSIINPEHYRDSSAKKAITFIKSHAEEYSITPTVEQVTSVTNGVFIEKMGGIKDHHEEWFLNEYETFARHRELELAILASGDLLEKGRYGEVERKIKDAVSIGLVKDLGLEYFKDPKKRLKEIQNNRAQISTGYRDLDKKLYGGMNRGEITIFLGQSGAGKSLFLQNISLNWAKMGLNVLYVSLELSENLCSLRIDAMATDYGTSEVLKNIDDVDFKVRKFHKDNKGKLWIKQMPSGTTVNDLKAYMKEFSVQTETNIDCLVVDYLDLMDPATKKVQAGDTFTKDKYVSEELRNVAVEYDLLTLSASQLNRSSYTETDFDNSHIAGGISKVNTADNVIGILMTTAMRDVGRYELQFMKTRSSSGVGSKINLGFNRVSLRILDYDDEEEEGSLADKTLAKIKPEKEDKPQTKEEKMNKKMDLMGYIK